MNAKNEGNQFTTYTILVMDESYLESASRLLRYLVGEGHKVTLMLGVNGHDGVKSSVETSDVTVVFSKQCNDYAKRIAELVRPIVGTFSILVTDEIEKEFNRFNFTYLESDFTKSGDIVNEEVHRLFGNLCSLVKLARYH